MRPPFTGSAGSAVATAAAADYPALAVISPSGQVSLEDPEHPSALEVLRPPDPTFRWWQDGYAVAFGPDDTTLAAGVGRSVTLWNLPGHAFPGPDRDAGTTLPATDAQSLAFSPDGGTLAVGEPGLVRLWLLRPGARPVPNGGFEHNASGSWALAFSPPDEHLLAAGGTTMTIWLWDLRAPGSAPVALTGPTATVTSLAFSPDGRILAAGDANGLVWLWRMAAASPPVLLGRPLAAHHGTVFDLAFAPDSRLLASASEDRTVALWDLENAAAPQQLGGPLAGYTDWVLSVAFQRSGDGLVTSTRDDHLVSWDVSELRALRDNAVHRACVLAGGGLSPQEWKNYIPGLDYQDSCAR
jgi:WD40 repeat protein